MRREPDEQRTRRLATEPGPRQTGSRAKRREPESGERQRVARDVHDRTEQLPSQLGLVAGERAEQPPPGRTIVGAAVGIEVRGGRGERPLEDDRCVRRRARGRRERPAR